LLLLTLSSSHSDQAFFFGFVLSPPLSLSTRHPPTSVPTLCTSLACSDDKARYLAADLSVVYRHDSSIVYRHDSSMRLSVILMTCVVHCFLQATQQHKRIRTNICTLATACNCLYDTATQQRKGNTTSQNGHKLKIAT